MATNVDLRGQGNRHHHTAQTSYLDETFTFGNLNTTNGPYTIGNLPAGAQILRVYAVTAITFSGATTIAANGVTAGAVSLAAGALTITTAGLYGAGATAGVLLTQATNPSPYAVLTEQTPVAITFTGGGALTTGLVNIIVEYATIHGPTGQF